MRKFTARLFGLIILAVLLIAVISGCNNTKQINEKLGDIKLDTLKPVTLTFYFSNGLMSNKSDMRKVLDEIEKRTKQLNIKLDFKWFSLQDYAKKIKIVFASGDSVDAVNDFKTGIKTVHTSGDSSDASTESPDAFCYGSDSGIDFIEMARNGEIKDITDLMPKYAPNLYKKYIQWGSLAEGMVDGKLVALPSLYPLATSNLVVVRGDYLTKYNIPDIKTYDDYTNYLKTVKENEMNITPGCMSGNIVELFARPLGYIVLDSNQWLVYKKDDPDMKVLAWEQTPEFKTAVKDIVLWYKNGYMSPNIQDIDPTKVSSNITYASIRYYEDGGMTFNNPNGITQKIFLLHPDTKVYRSDSIGGILDNGALVFNAKSQNVERALMFLNWVQQSQENYDLFMYGIEGKNYKLADGMIRLMDGENYEKTSYLFWPGCMTFRNIEYDRIFKSATEKQKQLNFIKSNTQYMPHSGFYPNYTSLSDNIDYRRNIIQNINDNLCNGTYTLDEAERDIEELKTHGSAKIIEVIQQQLDDWKAQRK